MSSIMGLPMELHAKIVSYLSANEAHRIGSIFGIEKSLMLSLLVEEAERLGLDMAIVVIDGIKKERLRLETVRKDEDKARLLYDKISRRPGTVISSSGTGPRLYCRLEVPQSDVHEQISWEDGLCSAGFSHVPGKVTINSYHVDNGDWFRLFYRWYRSDQGYSGDDLMFPNQKSFEITF